MATHEYPEDLQALITQNDIKFPSVEHIPAADALKLSATSAPPTTLFLDCRSEAEQSISIIPSAIPYSSFDFDASQATKTTTVICYCTIGYRSAIRAQELKVYNLSGSVLSWSHVGGTFVDSQNRPTNKLHVYGNEWDKAAPEIETVKFGFLNFMLESLREVSRMIVSKFK
ncbi:hypothetical protein TrST_g13906 [Triparma strigata]|uniref:Rhodanese domain-containing protein n=1 Tax=Triparma strigata TaxID=1606541 RepID=A0A9W7BFB5_9STRA|nr:hypothetical protein TrST_g13906 [Triparma strigata]